MVNTEAAHLQGKLSYDGGIALHQRGWRHGGRALSMIEEISVMPMNGGKIECKMLGEVNRAESKQGCEMFNCQTDFNSNFKYKIKEKS